jgi:hypothetical protein
MPDKDGKDTVLSSDLPQYLVVRLRPEDTKQFLALTERTVGKRLLVMLGDKPLAGWEGNSRFPEAQFEIPFHDPAELKKTEDDLKKLIR